MLKLILASACFLLVGCRGAPPLCDYYDPEQYSGVYQAMQASPIIIVGTVTSVTRVSSDIKARKLSSITLDLMNVEVEIENSIKGDVRDTRSKFFFFEFSTKRGYTGPRRYHVAEGDRRIFFLTRESGVLRAVGDGLDYTFHVHSGRHESVAIAGPNVGASISKVLLTLGRDFQPEAMARSIEDSAPVSDRFWSRLDTVAMLNTLLSASDVNLVSAACFELNESYYGQYGCLRDIKDSSRFSEKARLRAHQLLNKQEHQNLSLKRKLREYPLLAFSSSPFPNDLYAVRGELQMLLSDPDQVIRDLACDALRKNYPEPELRCGRSH